jgi:hypothetical protein
MSVCSLPVGMPSSLLPRPYPFTTVPSKVTGKGDSGSEGPTISGRSGRISFDIVVTNWPSFRVSRKLIP